MAITGSGTEQDPYLVATYQDIADAFAQVNLGNGNYVKLTADINCNDYGDTFEWEEIGSSYSTRWFDFDLNSHTIKNAKTKPENSFIFGNHSRNIIHNGKILNIFLSGAARFAQKVSFEKMSMSLDATGMNSQNAVFDGLYSMKECAVYVYSGSNLIRLLTFQNNSEKNFTNSDILMELKTYNDRLIMNAYADGVRLRGSMSDFNSNTPSYNCKYYDSVCNIAVGGTNQRRPFIQGGDPQTCVENCQITGLDPSSVYAIAVNSEEIINGTALRVKGFTVVNVVGD